MFNSTTVIDIDIQPHIITTRGTIIAMAEKSLKILQRMCRGEWTYDFFSVVSFVVQKSYSKMLTL